jgi:hypothetical protein
MEDRTKRIFIGDIHMGCDESTAPRKPYVWFNKNAPLPAQCLNDNSKDPKVNELIILGDLHNAAASTYFETAPHVPLGHPETMKGSQFHVGAASSRDELFEADSTLEHRMEAKMIYSFEINGLAVKTEDLFCTVDGGDPVVPGEFWRLIGKLIPGDVDHKEFLLRRPPAALNTV